MDEIIENVENLGLNVNPIYLDWDNFEYALTFSNDWDLAYGGYMKTFYYNDLPTLLYYLVGLEYFTLRHDDFRFSQMVWELYDMLFLPQIDPTIDLNDWVLDVLDKFHDVEERLWENQLIIPLAHLPLADNPLSDVLYVNAKADHVFNDQDLRFALSSGIDRNVVLNYHSTYNNIQAYTLYHLYQPSIYHDISLPNGVPI